MAFKCKVEEREEEMKKGKIILIAVVAFLAIGVISGIAHNITGTTPDDDKPNSESSEKIDMPTEIIWKEEDNMGILNLELDGSKTKEGIISEYYTQLSSYLKALDKENLGDYEFIQCVGNVVKDGKIECIIKGNLTVEFIKTSDNLSPAHLESYMVDLFIPKALQ